MKMNTRIPELDGWIALIVKHISLRPLMEPRDIYKLLYQGYMGPEHLVNSPSAFAERLASEYEALIPDQEDPLVESIHPLDALLRINLRSFKAGGFDLNLLLEKCLQTSMRKWGDHQDLQTLWGSVATGYRHRPFANFTPDDMDDFTTWLTSHDYPAIHHSDTYRQTYMPAYRLLAGDLAVQWTTPPYPPK